VHVAVGAAEDVRLALVAGEPGELAYG